MIKAAIPLYLERYAEPSYRLGAAWQRAGHPAADFAVVVPLLGEGNLARDLWRSLDDAAAHSGGTAVAIAVVNASAAHPEWVHQANAATLADLLTADARALAVEPPATVVPYSDRLRILVIDRARASWQMRPREGVGHVRKIGCDAALGLLAAGAVRCDILSTTDADARVAPDYFQWGDPSGGPGLGTQASAIVHPYRHIVEEGQSRPLLLYEIALRYYVLGLRAALSPYAFATIGSTVSFRAQAYARVRGFPKREAAEDFYFLDKLAKLGRVVTAGGEVRLVARASSRVPFGTGRAMRNIDEELSGGEPFRLYHPLVFAQVGRWLAAARHFAEHGDVTQARAEIGEPLAERLATLRAFDNLELALRERPSASDRLRHLMTWFDGLKTLKLIHALRDQDRPSVEWRSALRAAPFLSAAPAKTAPDLDWLQWIRRLDRG